MGRPLRFMRFYPIAAFSAKNSTVAQFFSALHTINHVYTSLSKMTMVNHRGQYHETSNDSCNMTIALDG
jgi:hypothetical protein